MKLLSNISHSVHEGDNYLNRQVDARLLAKTLSQQMRSLQNVAQKGFTLIELMITLVVAGIILSVATPSFIRVIDNNRVTTAANDFSASLALAKIEAVKRNRNVKIVAKLDSGGVRDWEQGYDIGVDLNDDDDFVDADETTLKTVSAAEGTVKISPVGPSWNSVATASPTVIEFNSLGGLNDTGHVAFDSNRYACRRTITLNSSGVYTLRKEEQPCELADI